jgi:hypothetical protein
MKTYMISPVTQSARITFVKAESLDEAYSLAEEKTGVSRHLRPTHRHGAASQCITLLPQRRAQRTNRKESIMINALILLITLSQHIPSHWDTDYELERASRYITQQTHDKE